MLRFLIILIALGKIPIFGVDLPPGFVLREPYAWPVKGIYTITGAFGEYRTNHFHMGQDFSTGGLIGIPILAVAKGQVTRVQRKWTSIGYAVFLQHEDGMTSRYGHLSKFAPKIVKQILKSKQARRFKDRIDFDIDLAEPVPLEKGELIAFSGDTGVGPPHLHLEIYRDGIYYNPIHFGLGYEKGEEVIFDSLRISPQSSRSFINGKNESIDIPFIQVAPNRYELSESPTLFIQGRIGFQVATHQKSNRSRLGVYILDFFMGDRLLQGFDLSRILKNHTRKSVLMYDSSISKPSGDPFSYFLFAREGNDLLGTLKPEKEQGIIDSENLKNGEPKEITIRAKGIGNVESVASFFILRDKEDYQNVVTKELSYNVYYDRYTTFKSKDTKVELFFPVNAIFSKGFFDINAKDEIKINTEGLNQLSSVYEIGPDFKDFNLGYDLYVKVPKSRDINSADLYEVLPDGRVKKVRGSSFSSWGQFFKVRLRKTGLFVVLSDQTPPTISLHENMKRYSYPQEDFVLLLKAVDIGSGVLPEGFDIVVDGVRGKAEYFPKDGRVEIFEPEILFQPGKHVLLASCRDYAGNWSSTIRYEYEIQPPLKIISEPVVSEPVVPAKNIEKASDTKKSSNKQEPIKEQVTDDQFQKGQSNPKKKLKTETKSEKPTSQSPPLRPPAKQSP